MKKILIIEDNIELRENISEILMLSNYDVISAENGKIGVEKAIANTPDLIVCDIMMPVLDGYGVYHLLSKHTTTASIPFIFLTAKTEKTDLRKGMEMGADDYITKPFESIDLLNAIETRLKKYQAIKDIYSGPEAFDEFLVDVKQSGRAELANDDRETYSYSKKMPVYKEGQRPRAMYKVISGKVKVSRSNDDGKEFITSIHAPGEYFGYTAILEDDNYKEQAEALEETKLMLIPREDFLTLITKDLQVSQTFIKIITGNILEKEEALLNLAYNSLRKKVAFGLIQIMDSYKINGDKNVVLNISRENMAQTIGIATESLIRTLSDFKDEQLIEINTGKVTIINENKLRALPF